MTKHAYPISELGILKPLMQKFTEKNSSLLPFINRYSSLESYADLIQQKADFTMDREILADDILDQYGDIPLSEATNKNIQRLRENNTYTVITGHQPCLFTGPLYFVIKILQTIKLANTLNAVFVESNIVPVYWMGGEDHDFAEINHFNLYRKTLRWESEQKGAVGRFSTDGLDSVFKELSDVLGDGKEEDALRSIFKKAYLEHDNYGEATRFLVNDLFGDRGLIIVEGDRPKLKEAFKSIVSKELKTKMSFDIVTNTCESLSKIGKIQVKPREINLFYLDEKGRDRIIATEKGFIIDNREGNKKLDELLIELVNHPEKFSPNVVLRPVYQETILPNLAYIGGPGELAYWLELKDLFSSLNMQMPILELRNSFVFIQQKQKDVLHKLGIKVKDLFFDENDWIKKLVYTNVDEASLFDVEKTQILAFMDIMKEKAVIVDPTLSSVFEGEKRKLEKTLGNLEKNLFKAQKRKSEVTINQVHKIKERLFPNGGLQERSENFSALYASKGKAIFDSIYDSIDPFEAKMNVIVL
jgi:bacillithiol biosynthesis cysteine-adding enzyme BshC